MANWASAKLAVDVSKETTREKREYQEALAERARQSQRQGLFGSLLSFLGGAFFGPLGYLFGNMIGTELYDAYDNAEDAFIGMSGKFNQSEVDELNKSLSDYDDKEDTDKLWGYATTALTSYAMSGGDDWTSFGKGEDAAKGWFTGGKEQAKAADRNFFSHFAKNPSFYKSVTGGAGANWAAQSTLEVLNTLNYFDAEAKCIESGGTWDAGMSTCYNEEEEKK